MEHKEINLKLKVWRQANKNSAGAFQTYDANNISTEMSFLEMFDVVNEKLINDGQDANAASVEHLIMNEVHAPVLVRPGRHRRLASQ